MSSLWYYGKDSCLQCRQVGFNSLARIKKEYSCHLFDHIKEMVLAGLLGPGEGGGGSPFTLKRSKGLETVKYQQLPQKALFIFEGYMIRAGPLC